MILLTITIFFLPLTIAFAMIARRIWQIRTGRFVVGSQYEAADWTELSIEIVRSRLAEWAKFSIHHLILFLLKVWVKTAYGIKRIDRYIKKRLTHLLHKNGHLPAGGKPSIFLKNMSDHKNGMPHITAAKNRQENEKVESEAENM